MYSFANDYSEGACPKVLKALIETNDVQEAGYGLDDFSLETSNIIKNILENRNVDVHFITGGTPCNILAVSLLKSYEAVIAAETGHINVHETGAIEATGHKILTVKGRYGKLNSNDIIRVVHQHGDEHMVKPKMVFISNATEFGTIYTKEELKDLYKTCKELNLYLYLDGARISNALVATGNDMTLKDICEYTDMFYIGGTKNGALIGEAMVIKNDELKPEFRYTMKQHGAMLAKGRLISVQLKALLENELYLENARNANIMAQALKYIFKQHGIPMYIDSQTNQIFPVISNKLLEKIKTKYLVTEWGKYDDERTIVRFACSWATKKEDLEEFFDDLVHFTEK